MHEEQLFTMRAPKIKQKPNTDTLEVCQYNPKIN